MTLETFLLWLVIGGIAGFLASAIVGGGYGLIGDIIIGVVGAFVGGWLFRAMGWHTPFTGMTGTVFVAFVGALLLLVVLRVLHRGRMRRI